MDPNIPIGSIAGNVVATILAAGILALLAWFVGPLKWLVLNRRLSQLILSGRPFLFVFNPVTGQSKIFTFKPNGEIGEEKSERAHLADSTRPARDPRLGRGGVQPLQPRQDEWISQAHERP